MLEAAGIQAYVPGKYLADEWGATQRLIGSVGADVFVARERVNDAREVIARTDEPSDVEAEQQEEDVEESVPASRATVQTAEAAPPSRRALLFEILAISGVVVVPFYIGAISGLIERHFQPWESAWSLSDSIFNTLYALPLIVLLRWVMSTSGQPPANFGWVKFRLFSDPFLALCILVGLAFVAALGALLLGSVLHVVAPSGKIDDFVTGTRLHGNKPDPTGSRDWLDWVMLMVSYFAMAALEEVSIRGYLFVRLRTVLASPVKAALISSLAWAGYHVYQGLLPVGVHFLEGLALAGVFVVSKRLWPLILAHAAINVLMSLHIPWE
jgi:membrane protease YdiL (CAAX protease family)